MKTPSLRELRVVALAVVVCVWVFGWLSVTASPGRGVGPPVAEMMLSVLSAVFTGFAAGLAAVATHLRAKEPLP